MAPGERIRTAMLRSTELLGSGDAAAAMLAFDDALRAAEEVSSQGLNLPREVLLDLKALHERCGLEARRLRERLEGELRQLGQAGLAGAAYAKNR